MSDRSIAYAALAISFVALLLQALPFIREGLASGSEINARLAGLIIDDYYARGVPNIDGDVDFSNSSPKRISILDVRCIVRTDCKAYQNHSCKMTGENTFPTTLERGDSIRLNFSFPVPYPVVGRQIQARYRNECGDDKTFLDYMHYLNDNYGSDYWGNISDESRATFEDFWACESQTEDSSPMSLLSYAEYPSDYRGESKTPFLYFIINTSLGERSVGYFYVGIGGPGGF